MLKNAPDPDNAGGGIRYKLKMVAASTPIQLCLTLILKKIEKINCSGNYRHGTICPICTN